MPSAAPRLYDWALTHLGKIAGGSYGAADTTLLGRIIRAQERRHAARDRNRVVRPFGWGAEFVAGHLNGDEPREVVGAAAREAVRRSEEFYALPTVSDYALEGDRLSWTSAVRTPSPENNTARARFFPEQPPERPSKNLDGAARRAVVVLPQWNADAESHVALCRVLNRFGIAALRLTMPYHEERRDRKSTRLNSSHRL